MNEHRLQELAPFPLDITWHENKSTYLSVLKKRGRMHLRLHRLFYDAPTPVLEALVQYAEKRDAGSKAVIKQMAHMYFSQTVIEKAPLDSKGQTYDLKPIFNQLRKTLPLKPLENVSIGWAVKRRRSAHFRSITFGVFDKHTRQIRINPILDDPEVPQYFLEYIIYHEMLHAVIPTKMGDSGRCSIHSKEFREKERLFTYYDLAKEWEKKSLLFFKKRHLSERRKNGRS